MIRTDRNLAYYNLLKCQAKYSLNKKITFSNLDFSISYFSQKHNSILLSRCYFYRACINYKNGGDFELIFKDLERSNANCVNIDLNFNQSYRPYLLRADSFTKVRQFDSALIYRSLADSLMLHNQQVDLVRHKVLDNVEYGIKWLYYVLNDEENIDFSKPQIYQLLECFRVLDRDFVLHLENAKLSPNEKLFCVLHRLAKSPQQIMFILNWSKDSYRQVKSLTLRKLKGYGGLMRFCDSIR